MRRIKVDEAEIIFRYEASKMANEVTDGMTVDEIEQRMDAIRATLREGRSALALCGLAIATRSGGDGENYWLNALRHDQAETPNRLGEWIAGLRFLPGEEVAVTMGWLPKDGASA